MQEVLPKAGLVYSEKGNLSEVLCKPKIMAIKSPSLVKLEEMEKLATSIEEQARARYITLENIGSKMKKELMPPGTAEEDRLPPSSENQGFRRNYFSFFGNPLTPNSSKFEISPKFCEAFFNPVKFRQIFIKICSKTREIDSKFAKNDDIWWKKLQK